MAGRNRIALPLVALLSLAACAGPARLDPVLAPPPALAPPQAPAQSPAADRPTTVVVVTNGARAEATEAGRQRTIPTERAVETPTAVPTQLPAPTPTRTGGIPSTDGRTFPPGQLSFGSERLLTVPYRSQLDGNPYEQADCGPASLAMVLAAYGKDVPTMEVRQRVNKLQGTEGVYNSGTAIESIFMVAKGYGLKPNGLWPHSKAKSFKKWTLDEVRAKLDQGQPIIPQVWYRGLPGRETKAYDGDHYIVLTGYVGDEFIYNDPADRDTPGYARRMSAAQLDKAWRNGDFPYAGVALGGPPERLTLTAPSVVAVAAGRAP
jgi:uncharacterized protein YvpB